MIWLCGDTHGRTDIFKVRKFFQYTYATKDDYLIILGDVAVCWMGEVGDERTMDMLSELPCTVLWLDGNHENFDKISTYPVSEWKGGKVHFIREDIIHLMRGQIYEIEGKTFFTFGGGYSIDKPWRTPRVSWWEQEMPSQEEYEEGRRNLELAGNKVDYVLTHTCPRHIAPLLVERVMPGEEQLQDYLEEISRSLDYQKWYFGHWHVDWKDGKFVALWQDIAELEN